MKIKILAIAPYPGLAKLIQDLAIDFPEFDLTVVKADMEESLPILRKFEADHFDFIISRGGTAKLLEKHTTIPVIEIHVSGYDALRILTLLKSYQSKIQMIGFSNIIHSFEAVSTLIDIDILYTAISHESEVEQALAQAKANGIQVVVGDTITVRLAKNIGLQGVLITSGRESVQEAFNIIIKMHRYISALESKNRHFEDLLNKLDDGMAIINKEGYILNANEVFLDMFRLAEGEEKRYSLFELYPFFNRLIERNTLDKGYKIEVFLFDKKYIVTSGKLNRNYYLEELFFIKFTNTEYEKYGFYVRYPEEMIASFPPLIISGQVYDKALSIAKEKIELQLPICIYGEKGSGKRLLVSLLQSKSKYTTGSLIEIVINNITISSFQVLLKKLVDEDPNTIIHLIGFENVPHHQQKILQNSLKNIRAQLIFSFSSDLNEISAKFEADMLKMLRENIIYIPPLRERLDEFEEFVRGFIFQFNEIYGKQIVGIQPKVMELLKDRQWHENFFELRKMIEELVKSSEGEYIEENNVSLLNKNDEMSTLDASDGIDMNQSLEKIEKQIIQMVLEEENMNQSKAAKRLGINRSTLWRKLRDDE